MIYLTQIAVSVNVYYVDSPCGPLVSLKALVISQAVQPSEGVGLLVAEFKRKLDAFPAAFALGLLTGQALSFFYVVVEMREIRDSNPEKQHVTQLHTPFV